MPNTDELLALSASNRTALRDLGNETLLARIKELEADYNHARDILDATLSKIADWAFVINQSRADRALITPQVQEMNGWVRDYA
jgi:hypothetical protein